MVQVIKLLLFLFIAGLVEFYISRLIWKEEEIEVIAPPAPHPVRQALQILYSFAAGLLVFLHLRNRSAE